MSTVEEGHTVVFHYTGTLEDGTVFDSSREREPMEIQVGSGQIISGLESGLVGMSEGETRTITVPPEDAFGERDENLHRKVEKGMFADPEGIKIGRMCQIPVEGQGNMVATIVEVGEEDVVIDLNHPLAGKEITFEVECLEVR